MTHTLDVDSDGEGAVAVPARLLVEIVRELPDVPINLVSEDSDRIILRTEKGEYKIATQPREDFPNITIEESEHNFWIDPQKLTRLTNNTIFAVSTDELRPALTGINVELVGADLIFVGTDGHRLAKTVLKNFRTGDTDQSLKMIVPTKALNLMLRSLEDAEQVNVQAGEDHVIFRLKNAVIYSKLINGAYPNYERVLPVDNDKTLRVNRELLMSTLRRVSIFSSSLTNQVRLVIAAEEVTIHSEDIEFGAEAHEAIPATFSDEWLQIGYNSAYLMDILRHIDTEEVIFDLKDGGSAAILHPVEQPEDEDVKMLLMPIRIMEDERPEE